MKMVVPWMTGGSRFARKVREGLNQSLTAEEMEEKVRYLSAFPSRVGNSAQRDFHRQLERKGIGRLIEALRNSDQK